MQTAASIRRFINRLVPNFAFTTRDCLSFGTRAAVDQALYRMVKAGCIVRVAFGVFVKPDPQFGVVISAFQVARIKAESFGRRIASHARDAAFNLGLIASGNRETRFAVNGRSSSFKFGDQVIYLHETSPRNMILGDRPAGMVVRALRYLGKSLCTKLSIANATREIGRAERFELRQRRSFMPAWLSDCFWIP